jgi:hypothetical protein
MSTMKAEIDRAMQALVGKAVWRYTRAADMACFDFGTRRTVPALRNGTKEVGKFALHVQCPWRITQEDRIVVGSQDLYYPAHFQTGQEIPAEFDWDREPNLRDKLLSELFEKQEPLVDSEIHVASAGRVCILLTDGLVFDILPTDSHVEWWRLFEPGQNKRHFVVGPTTVAGQI